MGCRSGPCRSQLCYRLCWYLHGTEAQVKANFEVNVTYLGERIGERVLAESKMCLEKSFDGVGWIRQAWERWTWRTDAGQSEKKQWEIGFLWEHLAEKPDGGEAARRPRSWCCIQEPHLDLNHSLVLSKSCVPTKYRSASWTVSLHMLQVLQRRWYGSCAACNFTNE